MKKIPSVDKHFIRSQYVRYRELHTLSGELSQIASLGQWCFWGGIVIASIWLIQLALGNEFPAVGVGFGFFIVGCYIKSGWLSKYRGAISEKHDIERNLKDRNVVVSSLSDDIYMYYQDTEEGTKFNPLSDEAFD